MDSFDRKILNLVQRNNRLTAEELSKEVGLSSTACQKRLRRLRDNGTIAHDISIISRSVVDSRLSMIIEVTLERKRTDFLNQFKELMLGIPEVMQCYYIVGKVDFILIITAKDMSDYENFTRTYLCQNFNVKCFHTNVVMDDVKLGFNMPLEIVA